jgi:hypothetical protein
MSEFHFIGAVDAHQFLVENGIPIPEDKRFRRGPTNYLHDVLILLEIGQSTTVPVDSRTGRSLVKVSNVTRDISGKEFVQRTMTENGQKFVRVWRVS